MIDTMHTPPPDEVRVPLVSYLHDVATHAPLLALSHTAQLQEMIHDARSLAIVEARLAGHSWRAIAEALGQHPATIHRRFAILDPLT